MSAPALPAPPAALPVIAAIALNTFREAIRDRVLYLLLIFALLLIATSRLLSLLTVGDEEKIIKDMGLSAISLFGLLTAVFVGVSLVFKEIERRTIYTLLAHPVRRWQFVVGKFAGLYALVLMKVGLMSAGLFAVLLWRGAAPWSLTPAIALIAIELAIITAFALLFSTVSNPILAAVSTAAIYVMGHLSWSLQLLREHVASRLGRSLCDAVYWVLPNLSRLDIKTEVVHGLPLEPRVLGLTVGYGVGYAALVLVLACAAFERRDFQ